MSGQNTDNNAVSSSAIHRTPVEIWMVIFSRLLDDPMVFRPNPFYSGCNPHTASREWNDYPRLREILNRQRNLRAVSKSWNNLVNSTGFHYYELSSVEGYATMNRAETSTNIRLSTRVYFNSSRTPCACICYCTCAAQDRRNSKPFTDSATGENIRNTLCHPDSNVTILSISAPVWECAFDRSHPPKSFNSLDRIKALHLFHFSSRDIDIPSICPNLVYLSIQVGKIRDSSTGTLPPPAVFPVLSTLILSLAENINYFLGTFQMPRLQNLEVVEYVYDQYVGSLFENLAARSWPYLVNLKIVSTISFIGIPPELWRSLPVLQYLGLSAISPYLTHPTLPPPPPDHPFHTFANFDMGDNGVENPRRPFAQLLENWPSVKVVADSHCWSKFSPVKDQTGGIICDHVHADVVDCCFCIEQLEVYCRERDLRYEDRYGRSWDEYATSRMEELWAMYPDKTGVKPGDSLSK